MSVNAISSGIPEFDHILRGLIAGDNVIFRGESISDYLIFVSPFAQHGLKMERPVVYFVFGKHEPLLRETEVTTFVKIDPVEGFEPFISQVHKVIQNTERRAFYVFDCLSDLSCVWFSDTMLCNFFMLTCPYLFDRGDLAYFFLNRSLHTVESIAPIVQTAQIVIDLYNHNGDIFIRPVKVQQRYSPSMHMFHIWKDKRMTPVTESHTIAKILSSSSHIISGEGKKDIWNRTLNEAKYVARLKDEKAKREWMELLIRMMITRERRMTELFLQYFTLEDLIEIGNRVIGTGMIGGKSVGMLLANAILQKTNPQWRSKLEKHDSFYIGSDVYYTFLVRNGCWWAREQQKELESFLPGAERIRRRIITGEFPEDIEIQFEQLLEYFGSSPIIVRSSSLLEDNFGNSFAGKYESVFCANQGSTRQRLEDFKTAVRTVYASTVSEEALFYRKRRGLLDRDEQMALLVQRVSGAQHGRLYFPNIAGVGFSYNPYVWCSDINPKAGMIRLVFGLGTRAVERSDDDYTRIIALNSPMLRPESSTKEQKKYSQRKVDVIDLDANRLVSLYIQDIIPHCLENIPLELFITQDLEIEKLFKERGIKISPQWEIRFDSLITKTSFVEDMREILSTLQKAYQNPVDIEFTANFVNEKDFYIDIVQCRPLQVSDRSEPLSEPIIDEKNNLLISTDGPIIGRSRLNRVHRIIYVSPNIYGELPISEKYAVARALGNLNQLKPLGVADPIIVLIGPGRWGTSTPSLGIPVTFSEISSASFLCEIVVMREDLTPDVSLGTHFFSELVESDLVYFVYYPAKDSHLLNEDLLLRFPNNLKNLDPHLGRYDNIIHVIDFSPESPISCYVYANNFEQKLILYLKEEG
ncbi:MAG: PEP/pyruvate-binding domain-containing protein [Candidatus Hydrogenedentes bacterium]|nr:PEP/pyruvate-binding domain-containing protein [Candidatus Hydrogenedentota bacterium]